MSAALGQGNFYAASEPSYEALVELAERLQRAGVPLGREFAEMVRAQVSVTPSKVCPTQPATELLVEPVTRAESISALILTDLAAHARDARLDDAEIYALMALASICVARFDSYLVERTTGAAC